MMLLVLANLAVALAQANKGYEITSNLTGLKEGSKVWMEMFGGDNGNKSTHTDSSYVKNGQFHISGVVPKGPRWYFLNIMRDNGWTGTIRLLINNGDHLTID